MDLTIWVKIRTIWVDLVPSAGVVGGLQVLDTASTITSENYPQEVLQIQQVN